MNATQMLAVNKKITSTACLAFAMGQVACWSCQIHLLIELSHSAMSPPLITKEMKLKGVKLLHQGHPSDSTDIIKSFHGILSFEATVDKARVCCSQHPCYCMYPKGFTANPDLALTPYFWCVSATWRHFSKHRSLMSKDYGVVVSFIKSQESHVVC